MVVSQLRDVRVGAWPPHLLFRGNGKKSTGCVAEILHERCRWAATVLAVILHLVLR